MKFEDDVHVRVRMPRSLADAIARRAEGRTLEEQIIREVSGGQIARYGTRGGSSTLSLDETRRVAMEGLRELYPRNASSLVQSAGAGEKAAVTIAEIAIEALARG